MLFFTDGILSAALCAPPHKTHISLRTTHLCLCTTHHAQIIVRTPLGKLQIITPLLGKHNVYNILAAVATGICLKVSFSVWGHPTCVATESTMCCQCADDALMLQSEQCLCVCILMSRWSNV